MAKRNFVSQRITTPEFRVSFPKVFKPESFNDSPLKYSVVMLFDKNTDISALKRAAKNVFLEKWPEENKRPRNPHSPFRDGDTEKPDVEGYENSVFVYASCLADRHVPGVLDETGNRIMNESEFYAGCYAKAIIDIYAFDNKAKKGVTCGLVHLMKTRDGETFSGAPRVSPEEAFGFTNKDGEYLDTNANKKAANSDVDDWL